MKHSNKYPKVIISDSEKNTIDKELLMKALSKPENQEKILKINQEIMKALNDNVMYIDLKPYSASEKSKIITRYLQGDLGIVVESSIEKSLQRYLTINNSINTAKDCVK